MINTRRSPRSSPTGLLRHALALSILVVALPVRCANATTADDLCPSDVETCFVTTQVTVTDGSVLAFGQRALFIHETGILDAGSGALTIMAGSLTVLGDLRADGRDLPGGRISVSADTIIIAGTVSATGSDGGVITLAATGELTSGGDISASGMPGVGGNVELLGGSVSIAGDVWARSLGDNLGGCVTVSADVDIDLVAPVRMLVTGGDGGEIVVVAGLVGGDLRIGPDAVLSASGAGANGGSGGGIELSARGDGIVNGHVRLDGDMQARAGSLQGGDGGCITVSAAGDVIGESSAAELNVNSGTPDGFAGEINVVAAGNVELKIELLAQGTGSEGAGGDIEVQSGGDLLLDENARISVAGPGDGGSIDLIANQGEVMIRSTAVSSSVDASGTSGGDGGVIRIGASGMQGRIVVAGTVSANGSTAGAAGGSIELSAGHTLIMPGAPMPGRLQAQGGTGGTITMRTVRGPLQLDGAVSAGGMITSVSGGELAVGGTLAAADDLRGGRISLEASGPVTIVGTVDASGSPDGNGGTIDVVGAGPVSIAGQLNADGSASAGTLGGNVALRGCDVSLTNGGVLSAKGNTGLNRVTGRRAIVISGMLMADAATGHNELVYRDAGNPPVVFASASVVPAATLVVDASLPACAVCGDRNVEPPETCDDGNQDDGDGCSSTCQVEAAQCDVDGDGDIDRVDLLALESELFDGDGDRTLDVGGGDFPGTVGADANEDGRVSSADIARCIEVVGGE